MESTWSFSCYEAPPEPPRMLVPEVKEVIFLFCFAKSKTYYLPNKTSDEQIEEHFCLHRVSSFSPLLCSLRINGNLPVGACKEKGIKLKMIYICDNQCEFRCVTISIIHIIKKYPCESVMLSVCPSSYTGCPRKKLCLRHFYMYS